MMVNHFQQQQQQQQHFYEEIPDVIVHDNNNVRNDDDDDKNNSSYCRSSKDRTSESCSNMNLLQGHCGIKKNSTNVWFVVVVVVIFSIITIVTNITTTTKMTMLHEQSRNPVILVPSSTKSTMNEERHSWWSWWWWWNKSVTNAISSSSSSTSTTSEVTVAPHHQTIPTLLSIIDDSTFINDATTTTTKLNSTLVLQQQQQYQPYSDHTYMYALDNPYYDGFVQQQQQQQQLLQTTTTMTNYMTLPILIHWNITKMKFSMNQESIKRQEQQQHHHPHPHPHPHPTPEYSMTLRYTTYPFKDRPRTPTRKKYCNKNDLLVLFCSNNNKHTNDYNYNTMNVMEVATIGQVRMTHNKVDYDLHKKKKIYSSQQYNERMIVQSLQQEQYQLPLYDDDSKSNHNNNNNNINEDDSEYDDSNDWWYVPNIPTTLLRQKECYWVYYYHNNNNNKNPDTDDDDDVDDNIISNNMINIDFVNDNRQYIPIGRSNIYTNDIQFMLQPTSLHMSITSQPDQMLIQFTTGTNGDEHYYHHKSGMAGFGTPIVEYSETTTTTTVMTDSTNDAIIQNFPTIRVSGTTDTYDASDMCQEPANITGPGKFTSPGYLHSVVLSNLQSNTMYKYRVGIETGQGVIWNDEHNYIFHTPLVAGDTAPYTFLIYGDQGCPSSGWDHGKVWIEDMVDRELFHPQPTTIYDINGNIATVTLPIRIIHHVGDLSYAQGAAHIWDAWMDMIQPISSYVPIMVAIGNHEYDHTTGGGTTKDPSHYVPTESGFMPIWGNFGNDSGGECGVPTSKRFTMPKGSNQQDIPNNGVFWYWYDYGILRTIVLSSEHDLSEGSIQHRWLESILQSTNRTITPWVVVETHRPLYEMEELVYPNPIGIAMRYEFEDLLYDYNVDIVFSGHFHTYHRTCDGLYHNLCNIDGAPIHITVGTAGAHLNVPDANSNVPTWTEQIIYQTYGYGRVTVYNHTTLLFQFIEMENRNTDSQSTTTAGSVLDEVYITRTR